MKTLTINRKKWARGGEKGEPRLLNDQGAMCCLGFFALKQGLTRKEILHVGQPDGVFTEKCLPAERASWVKRKFQGLVIGKVTDPRATRVCNKLMRVNDDTYISDTERESKLTRLFAKIGWKPRFIN